MRLGPLALRIMERARLGRGLGLTPEEIAKLASMPGISLAARAERYAQAANYPAEEFGHGKEVRKDASQNL